MILKMGETTNKFLDKEKANLQQELAEIIDINKGIRREGKKIKIMSYEDKMSAMKQYVASKLKNEDIEFLNLFYYAAPHNPACLQSIFDFYLHNTKREFKLAS